jgi:hypothetical protein
MTTAISSRRSTGFKDGRLDDIKWGYRCTSGDQYLVSGIGLPARYSFYVAPRAKRLNQLRDDPVVAVDTTPYRPMPCSPVDDV